MRPQGTSRDAPRTRLLVGRRTVGIAAALAALLGVYVVAPAQAQDPGGTYGLRFVAVSRPLGAEGADPPVTDLLGMNGDGSVTVGADPLGGPVTEGEVQAGGPFIHWDSAEALPVPKPILAQGTWTADKLVSFEVIGTYGNITAGTLVMDVTLYPDGGDPVPAQLTIVCNSPPGAGGLLTGLLEGWYLTGAEMSFEPFGVGLTTFGLPT